VCMSEKNELLNILYKKQPPHPQVSAIYGPRDKFTNGREFV
jgi:hypothetical protein